MKLYIFFCLLFTIFLFSSINLFAQIVLHDDFESYTANNFPSSGSWYIKYNGAGDRQQYISNDHSNSGSKSFRLHGVQHWDAKILNKLNSTPDDIKIASVVNSYNDYLQKANMLFDWAETVYPHKFGNSVTQQYVVGDLIQIQRTYKNDVILATYVCASCGSPNNGFYIFYESHWNFLGNVDDWVVCQDEQGNNNGFFYSWWTKGKGSACIVLGFDGNYSAFWNDVENIVGGKGWKPGSTSRVVGYNARDWSPRFSLKGGNSYLALYGWTRDPLIEYYIVDNWSSWRPPFPDLGLIKQGTVDTDGGTYYLYRTVRKNKDSIDGVTTFYQYWSVRSKKRPTEADSIITFENHVNAWKNLGWDFGTHDYQIMATEGWNSSGTSNITVWEVNTNLYLQAPTPIGPNGITGRYPIFTWNEVPGAEKYALRVLDMTGRTWLYGGIRGVSVKAWAPLPSYRMKFQVQAIAGSNHSVWSKPMNFKVQP